MSIQIRFVGVITAAIFADAAMAQVMQVVEWKTSEGGNGHWYGYVCWDVDHRWYEARDCATSNGGHLATLTTSQEDAFVTGFAVAQTWQNPYIGPWIGASASNPCANGESCFSWVTGEPLAYSRWHPGNPDDVREIACPGVTGVCLWDKWGTRAWQDASQCHGGTFSSALIEWDADCNADGIVDYGQILRGQLDDDNTNGIPDVCETSVTGVIPPSVPAQGGTTVTVKGTNFPANPSVRIGGVAATNVVRLSATRITATSPALLPGMTSIAVDNFTLPEAIYIRPECGSDLDQNGVVDTADISIILLDFGPCYETPAALAESVPPLLEPEPMTHPRTRR